jgi:hypothetical protein
VTIAPVPDPDGHPIQLVRRHVDSILGGTTWAPPTPSLIQLGSAWDAMGVDGDLATCLSSRPPTAD